MKSDQLLRLMNDIDDRWIESAAMPVRPSTGWRRWTAIVAAAVLLVALSAAGLWKTGLFAEHGPLPQTPIVVTPARSDTSGGDSQPMHTSDTYSSLEELLLFLSTNEEHDTAGEQGTDVRGSANAGDSFMRADSAVVFEGYSYHVGTEDIRITDLRGESPASAGVILQRAAGLYLYGAYLVAVDSRAEEGASLEKAFTTEVTVFDLSDPSSPQVVQTIRQTGELCGSFLADGVLWLLSADGECACGYSRLDDPADYIPTIQVGEERIPIGEGQLHILGEPSRVRYVAVSAFSLRGQTVGWRSSEVFYGDVQDMGYGADYVALTVSTADESGYTQPSIYFLTAGREGELSYTGRLDTAALLGLPARVKADEASTAVFRMTAISKVDGVYRLNGIRETRGGVGDAQLVCITASAELETIRFAESAAIPGSVDITEILDEPDRQILCYAVYDRSQSDWKGRFATVVFDGSPVIHLPALSIPYMNGIDRIYGMGRPYGYIQTMVPLDGGLYLRYSGLPDGLALYDIADAVRPVCRYQPDRVLSSEQRFCYRQERLDKKTVGMIVLTPAHGEDGEWDYRRLTAVCRLYAVDPDAASPYTIVGEQPVEGYENAAFFRYDGVCYVVTPQMETPVALN